MRARTTEAIGDRSLLKLGNGELAVPAPLRAPGLISLDVGGAAAGVTNGGGGNGKMGVKIGDSGGGWIVGLECEINRNDSPGPWPTPPARKSSVLVIEARKYSCASTSRVPTFWIRIEYSPGTNWVSFVPPGSME